MKQVESHSFRTLVVVDIEESVLNLARYVSSYGQIRASETQLDSIVNTDHLLEVPNKKDLAKQVPTIMLSERLKEDQAKIWRVLAISNILLVNGVADSEGAQMNRIDLMAKNVYLGKVIKKITQEDAVFTSMDASAILGLWHQDVNMLTEMSLDSLYTLCASEKNSELFQVLRDAIYAPIHIYEGDVFDIQMQKAENFDKNVEHLQYGGRLFPVYRMVGKMPLMREFFTTLPADIQMRLQNVIKQAIRKAESFNWN